MRRPSPEALDLTRWPGVDSKALTPDRRRRYQQRADALELYAKGRPLDDIEQSTGVDRRTLYRALERALKPHPDGRAWGFRALIPALRVKAYERQSEPVQREQGLAGAFEQFLSRHESLERLVRRCIQTNVVWLIQRGTQPYLRGLNDAHARFVVACRALGLTARDYPLNHKEGGKRALSRALLARMVAEFSAAARAAGAPHLKPAAALKFAPERIVTEPFDTVEFDAHKLDVRLKILDQDPYGEEHVFEIDRIWMLAILDVATRAILGYTLCLKREYNRFDVIRTFERALAPVRLPDLTIPGVVPMPAGGYVSIALPETQFACWQRIRFDNAKAHLAADSLDVACEILGCTVDVGPPYQPDNRPFIERFFGTVAAQFSHRLPGTTGSRPDDIVRALRKPRGELRLVVSLDELKELLAVWVWNYNGSPHQGIFSRTPLEAMHAAVREKGCLLRHLPTTMQQNLCLLQSPHRAIVRGNMRRGEKPHVSFYHVRYTSLQLARAAHLIGKELRLYYDVDDIRRLRAYCSDGTELGELVAGGMWRQTPHDLDTRIRIFAAKRARGLRFADTEDPIHAYLDWKRKTAGNSRRDASRIAQVKEVIGRNSESSGKEGVAPPSQDHSPLPLATGPVRAKRLSIPPGFA